MYRPSVENPGFWRGALFRNSRKNSTVPTVWPLSSSFWSSFHHIYQIFATGLLSAGDLQPLILLDDLSIGSGARVRFVHTGPDAPSVDVAVTGGPVLFLDVSFREASAYGEVEGGTYDLEVRVAGTETVALPLPRVNLGGGATYTVFAIGLLADGSLAALPVVDAP